MVLRFNDTEHRFGELVWHGFYFDSETNSLCVSVCLSVCLSACLSVCLSVCLSFSLSLSLSLSFSLSLSLSLGNFFPSFTFTFRCFALNTLKASFSLFYIKGTVIHWKIEGVLWLQDPLSQNDQDYFYWMLINAEMFFLDYKGMFRIPSNM